VKLFKVPFKCGGDYIEKKSLCQEFFEKIFKFLDKGI
jgi:hypothetical protein